MRAGPKTLKRFSCLLFVLFLLTVAVYGVKGYYAGIGSDPYGIIHFARHLARGKIYSDFPVYHWMKGGEDKWGPGDSYFVLHGNYILSGGRIYCKYTIGFPLLLALSIRIFGTDSVYFTNIVILLILLGFYSLLARLIFSDRKEKIQLSVFCPILLLVMISRVWHLSLRPSRDLSALLFVVAGAFFSIKALRPLPRIRWSYLIGGAFCLGFSASIRLPNILVGLPGGIFLLARLAGRVGWRRFLAGVVIALIFFSLGVVPALLQNYLATEHPLKPPRPEIVERNPLKVEGETSPPPLWLGFFKTTAPDTAAYFWTIYGPIFSLLILLGFLSGVRSDEIRYLVAGIPVIFILFYSMWVHLMIRYMAIAQPFLILLAAGGILRLAGMEKKRWWIMGAGLIFLLAEVWFRWHWRHRFGLEKAHPYLLVLGAGVWICATWRIKKWKASGRIFTLALLAFLLFAVRYSPSIFSSDKLFQLPEARRLGEDVGRLVEEGSVILATKPVSNYLALFTSSYSIRPFEMERVGVDPVRGIERMLERGVKLYLIDSSGWKRDTTKAIPGLEEYFDVIPVGTLPVKIYHLEEKFGKPVSTVYRIKSWSIRDAEIELSVPPSKGDYLLTIDPGRIYREGILRRMLTLRVNGQLLDQKLTNGYNFFRVPSRLLDGSTARISLSSDRPLPSRFYSRLQPLAGDYVADLGRQLKFPDKTAEHGFDEARLRDADLVRMGWDQAGIIYIPTARIADTGLLGEIVVNNDRDLPGPVTLAVSLNGRPVGSFKLPSGSGWRRLRFLLPPDYIDSLKSELELTASPPADYELSLGEYWAGSLLVEEAAVKREKLEVELATPVRQYYYFLSFSFRPSRPVEACPGPFRATAAGKVVGNNLDPGQVRLLLSPEDIVPPLTPLRVVGTGSGCAGLIASDPVVKPLSESLTVDLGAEDDQAFIRSGFFDREEHLGRTGVRWTGRKVRLIIPLPGGEKEIRLEIKAVSAGPPRRSGERAGRVLLDGDPVGSLPLEKDGGRYSFLLPPVPGARSEEFRLAELELIVPTWRPSRYLKTADSRDLGLMLDWIRIDYR